MQEPTPACDSPRTVVLIPAFNEQSSVGGVVARLRQQYDFPVVVIDDASSDQTRAAALAAGATVLPLTCQLGAWGATQTGIRYALRQGFDYAVTMDADNQHPVESLPDLLAPVLAGRADVAIGACTRRGSRLRRVAWVMLKAASGVYLDDVTSGFRVYNRAALSTLADWRATLLDYQDIGVLLLLQKQGHQLCDVAVSMAQRQSGGSRVFHSWLIVVYYMLHTLLLGFSKRPIQHSAPRAAGS